MFYLMPFVLCDDCFVLNDILHIVIKRLLIEYSVGDVGNAVFVGFLIEFGESALTQP